MSPSGNEMESAGPSRSDGERITVAWYNYTERDEDGSQRYDDEGLRTCYQ